MLNKKYVLFLYLLLNLFLFKNNAESNILNLQTDKINTLNNNLTANLTIKKNPNLKNSIKAKTTQIKDTKKARNPIIEITIEYDKKREKVFAILYFDKAPLTTLNFMDYISKGFYNNTIFHRLEPNFVIQGGGFTPGFRQKKAGKTILNEARSDLKNIKGTLAMARRSPIHSATSQFYINLKNNPDLDHKNKTLSGYGYAVFGKIIENMEYINQLSQVETTTIKRLYTNVPKNNILIKEIKIIRELY